MDYKIPYLYKKYKYFRNYNLDKSNKTPPISNLW